MPLPGRTDSRLPRQGAAPQRNPHYGARQLIACTLIGYACSGGEPPRVNESPTESHRILISGRENLSNPIALAIAGDFIAVADDPDSSIRLFHRKTGRAVDAKGREGEGPGEFREPWSLQALRGDTGWIVWAYDTRLRRLIGYRIAGEGKLAYSGRTVQLQLDGLPLSVQWINDTSLAGVGFFEDGRFVIADSQGRRRKAMGIIPLAEPGRSAIPAQQALQATLAIDPGQRRIAVASRYAARVDLYDLRTGALQPADAPLEFEPTMNLEQRGEMTIFVSDGSTRFGYIAVAATRDRVLALFSGRTRAEFPGRANVGDQLHIFTWEGVFVGAVNLMRETLQFAIDSTGTHVYGISVAPEPAIYVQPISLP